MAEKLWTRAEIAVGVVVGMLSVASNVGVFFILPYRVEANEKHTEKIQNELRDVQKQRNEDKEFLVRMDERAQNMQKQLDRIERAIVPPRE